MRNRATLRDIAVIGGQPHDVLTVFGHVQNLAAILVHVGYLNMIVRCRTTSHDIMRRRDSSYDICVIVVRRRRKTSSRIVRHRTTVIRSSYGIVEVARPSRDFNL